MKAILGYLELVIIMIFMICGMPLLIMCVKTSVNYKYTYLTDKSTYKMYDGNEETIVYSRYYRNSSGASEPFREIKSYEPVKPLSMDISGLVFMNYVGDDFSTGTQRSTYYNTDILSSGYQLQIKNGWTGLRDVQTKDIANRLMGTTSSARNAYFDANVNDTKVSDNTQFYMYWETEKGNPTTNVIGQWALSTKPVLFNVETK